MLSFSKRRFKQVPSLMHHVIYPRRYTTEILKIECREAWGFWVGGRWPVHNQSGGYHGLLKIWWDLFGLQGRGLVIGEEGIFGKNVKKKLKEAYPLATEISTVGLRDADIIWDITKPLETNWPYDWIICQAVMEHVSDPVSAVKNMAQVLRRNGRLFVHTHGPEFPHHPYPQDCYRFFRDALVAWADLAHLELIDLLWDPRHCFAAYRKA
jgi:SAM-dependent methyltransferase